MRHFSADDPGCSREADRTLPFQIDDRREPFVLPYQPYHAKITEFLVVNLRPITPIRAVPAAASRNLYRELDHIELRIGQAYLAGVRTPR